MYCICNKYDGHHFHSKDSLIICDGCDQPLKGVKICSKCKGRGKVGGFWDFGPGEIVGGTTCPDCGGND